MFRDIPGFPEYQIDHEGVVLRKAGTSKCKTARVITPWLETNGYVVAKVVGCNRNTVGKIAALQSWKGLRDVV